MGTRKERLKEVFDYLRAKGIVHTKKDFGISISQTLPAMYSAFNGDEKYLTDNLFKRICSFHPGIFNLDYLLTGEGELLQIKNETAGTIDQGSLVNLIIESQKREMAAKDETIAELRDRVSEQKITIADLRATIAELRSQLQQARNPDGYSYRYGVSETKKEKL